MLEALAGAALALCVIAVLVVLGLFGAAGWAIGWLVERARD